MITYVNTVLVGKGTPSVVEAATTANAGKYIIANLDETINKQYLAVNDLATANEIKVGLITSKTTTYINPSTKASTTVPVIKWSNNIKRSDIKSLSIAANPGADVVKEKVVVDFSKITDNALAVIDDGGFNIVLRLTYKDLPTRYRKWTESYNYVTVAGDTAEEIADGFAKAISKKIKNSRVTATASDGVLTIEAKEYDDDNAIDTINLAGQVRFNANIYYTNPNGVGFSSKNKYSLDGVTIKKTVGKMFQGAAKLVRDREAQAMGYEGILNRGEGTWPIIKPDMQTDLSKKYDVITLEFENTYRAADDIFRKTKQTLEIYDVSASTGDIATALKKFAGADTDGVNFINV